MTYFDLDKIPPEKILSSISMAISLLRKAYQSVEKLFGKKKADKMLSSVFGELLKENPDLDAIKARLNSFRPLKPDHSLSLKRAESMLAKVEAHQKAAKPPIKLVTRIRTTPKTKPSPYQKPMKVKVIDRRKPQVQAAKKKKK